MSCPNEERLTLENKSFYSNLFRDDKYFYLELVKPRAIKYLIKYLG